MYEDMKQHSGRVWDIRKTKRDNNRSRYLLIGGIVILIPLILNLLSLTFVRNLAISETISHEFGSDESIESIIDFARSNNRREIGIWGNVEISYLRILYDCNQSQCELNHIIVGTGTRPQFSFLPIKNPIAITEYGFDVHNQQLLIQTVTNNANQSVINYTTINNIVDSEADAVQYAVVQGADFIVDNSQYKISTNWGSAWNWDWQVRLFTDDDGLTFVFEQ